MAAVFYLDTSAVVRRYSREPAAGVLGELLEKSRPDERLYISSLVLVELCCTIARQVRPGGLSQDAAAAVLGRFMQDLEGYNYRVLSVHDRLLVRAVANGFDYKLRALDAIHLAIASVLFTLAGAVPQKVMVSTDRELLRAAESSGFKTLDPSAADALTVVADIRSFP